MIPWCPFVDLRPGILTRLGLDRRHPGSLTFKPIGPSRPDWWGSAGWSLARCVTPFYHPYTPGSGSRYHASELAPHGMRWSSSEGLRPDALDGAITGRSTESRDPSPVGFRGLSSSSTDRGTAWAGLTESSFALTRLAGVGTGSSNRRPARDSSDSLYRATAPRLGDPSRQDVQGLRLLVRPPVTYYLAGRVGPFSDGGFGINSPEKAGDPPLLGSWSTAAILRSEPGPATSGWSGSQSPRSIRGRTGRVVEEIPTTPSVADSCSTSIQAAARSRDRATGRIRSGCSALDASKVSSMTPELDCFTLARSRRTGDGHRPLSADHDGRLRRRRD